MATPRTEDHALLARIAGGDRVALEMLYRRHGEWVTSRLQRRCGDEGTVDEAVQDTFLAVWKSAKKYKGSGDVGAWIWGIAIRRLIDILRKNKPVPVETDRYNEPASPGFEEELLASGAYGNVGEAVRAMPADLQRVLLATAIDGLSTKEAARLLDIPQGTVKTRLKRAREHLQGELT